MEARTGRDAGKRLDAQHESATDRQQREASSGRGRPHPKCIDLRYVVSTGLKTQTTVEREL